MDLAPPLSDARRRLLELLKRRGPAAPTELARALAITTSAVRQHLDELERHGLVEREPRAPRGRGRPGSAWRLSAVAHDLFPDRHADLTVELIDGVRRTFGNEGLDRLIELRRRNQVRAYRRVLPPREAPLGERVEALAHQRTAEGYMAEVVQDDDGSYLLIEHHCPICDAAAACTGLCRAELQVFRAALGREVVVEREQHLLAGDARCVYRVRPRLSPRASPGNA